MTGSHTSLLPTRVLCVDDNVDATSVLRLLIGTDPTMCCVGCLSTVDQMETEIARLGADAPLVVILDATMPEKSPLEAMRRLAPRFPKTRMIVYSAHDDPAFVQRAMDSGAWGFVSKNDEPRSILHAVRDVATGRRYPGPAAGA